MPVYPAKVASERWRDRREEGDPQAEKAYKDLYLKAVLVHGTVAEGAVDLMIIFYVYIFFEVCVLSF